MLEITVTQGNGRRLTLDEIMRGVRPDGTAAANQQIEEENKRIAEANEIIGRTFKAGNEALTRRVRQAEQRTLKRRFRNTQPQSLRMTKVLLPIRNNPRF